MTENTTEEKPTLDPHNVYELMENDEGEVMVLIFAGEGKPQNPTFALYEKEKLIEITRSKNDIILIEGLQPEAIEKLKKLKTLYVCEMKYNENPEAENEIVNAYAATVKKKPNNIQEQSSPKAQPQEETLAEKARKARENLLNKNNSNQ